MLDAEKKKQLSFLYKQLDNYELVRCQNDVRACNFHMQASTCSIIKLISAVMFVFTVHAMYDQGFFSNRGPGLFL